MAGKNAYFRLLAIDNALQSSNKYNWKMLANICEEAKGVRNRPSERTIQGDISTLKKIFDAPIPKRCLDGYWFYTDPSFSFTNSILFVKELELLGQVKNILGQFPELNFSKDLERLIQKAQNRLDIKPISSPKIIQFEKSKNIIGAKYLDSIYKAILEKKVLQLSYHSFIYKNSKEVLVHPYFLKQYNSRWFLVAWQEDQKMIRLFGLERIKKINPSDKTYKSNHSLKPESYFNNVIGVSIPDNKKIQTVQLQISSQRTPYILTKLLHTSQKQIKKTKDNGIIIELKVIPNFELKALILSHGSAIKVLKPKTLVEEVQKEIEDILKGYAEA